MWEVEYEHVDKVEGVHRHMLIDRSVTGRDGQPARYEFIIRLGVGSDGESCPHCDTPIQRVIQINEQGHMIHAGRGKVTPQELVKEKLDELNAFHGRMDAYIKHHKATPFKAGK